MVVAGMGVAGLKKLKKNTPEGFQTAGLSIIKKKKKEKKKVIREKEEDRES